MAFCCYFSVNPVEGWLFLFFHQNLLKAWYKEKLEDILLSHCDAITRVFAGSNWMVMQATIPTAGGQVFFVQILVRGFSTFHRRSAEAARARQH